MDSEQSAILSRTTGYGSALNTASASDVDLDVCILMLYGHILFSSTSYTYALGQLSIGFFDTFLVSLLTPSGSILSSRLCP
jgi:hypothetical protein